ncbi:MAG: hypothetical protein A2Z96_07265 [Spirochaetes bacterium GWB1_48_6]|nr:MAG: hypothetical protein A2Z96_07265 [Spirochaetes bacterium GWB1_48_6]
MVDSVIPSSVPRQDLEKEIFDLRNLLEISKSLNSTLDYNILNDSILYTCLGSLTVMKAGFFSKKSIDSTDFTLHRAYLGFELDHAKEYSIAEKSGLIDFLTRNYRCFTLEEMIDSLEDSEELESLKHLNPSIIVPLRAKGQVNGLLVLGKKIDETDFTDKDKDYLLNIANFASIAIHNAFLFEMTTTDMMTKLKMKHFFINLLHEKMALVRESGGDVSVIMIDIDHFKMLNDTHGHLAGDEVLKKVSKTLQDNLRQIDVAARYGGEEFIVLLPDADIAMARLVAERVRKAIEKSKSKFHEFDLRVTVSLGIAHFDVRRDLTERHLIERADKALYRSKEHGRNLTTISE